MAMAMAREYITTRAAEQHSREASVIITRIKDFFEKKLWHQLTEEVKLLMQLPGVPDKCGMYSKFMKDFQTKLNPVSLVQIVIAASRSELSDNPQQALSFLLVLVGSDTADSEKTVVTEDSEAHVLLMSEVACLYLQVDNKAECKSYVRKAREIVDAGHEFDPLVHSAFYKCAAEYHKVVGTAADFFKNALQFLAYTPVETMEVSVQNQWAFDIGIAALVGTDVYNFGEVLSHTIIQVLNGSEHDWLLRLLEAFNDGDLAKFDTVCKSASKEMNDQPALVAHQEFLRQKITILALMRLASSGTESRTLPFKEVEKVCRLPAEEVEFLLMRSMSLGLITGVIDNVDQNIVISRVQPRVLDKESIGLMSKRLATWCKNVDSTLDTVSKNTVALVE